MTDPTTSSAELRRSISEATERIHAIIDDAEKAAMSIREEATRDGDRYLADRRAEAERRVDASRASIDALATVLNASAERMQSESKLVADELVRTVSALRESAAELPTSDAPAPPPAPVAEPEAPAAPFDPAPGPSIAAEPPAPAPEPAPPAPSIVASTNGPTAERSDSSERSPADDAGGEGDQVEALLRATQMAVKGSSREEIAGVLREQYRLSNPDAILDEILGDA
jgi:hypothetical protein